VADGAKQEAAWFAQMIDWTAAAAGEYTVKYPYIYGYFVASFPHLNGNGSVYVYVRKSTE